MTTSARHRILFLTHTGSIGGAELSLLDLLRPYKDSSEVVIFGDGPLLKRLQGSDMKSKVYGLSMPVRRGSSAFEAVLSLGTLGKLINRVQADSKNYDLIYTNTLQSAIVGLIAGQLSGRPVISHLRDILSKEHFSKFNIMSYVRLANQFAKRVIANSEVTSRSFIESGGDPNLVRVIYNGFEGGTLASLADGISNRIALGIPADSKLIGCFSRISPWKGQDLLIRAAAKLRGTQTKHNPYVLIVGAALFGEDAFQKKLQELACQLGITDQVKFLGFRDDVAALMSLCDVIVQPSISAEPFGRAIVEGMLAQRPVIASTSGAAIEIIEHGKTGLLFSAGDVEDLAKQLVYCFADDEASQRLAAAGAEAASIRFSLLGMHLAIDEIVESCFL